ncbi:MAG: branched-chain amino acid ABC transporter permease [Chloroflexi bacterium]|nr:MAG: branched-chain amino acid ABC transporter permease [Phototrophicales bacterium]RMF78764.1 MAG: branched-chain amino acid ABC transporter permease [Chloroflexota bacterium]
MHAIILIWLLLAGPVWAAVGALRLPRQYHRRGLDSSQSSYVGTLAGLVAGPFALYYLWQKTPSLSRRAMVSLFIAALAELFIIFALFFPDNLCATNHTYVTQQVLNGLTIGTIYALMAIGLTLIYSIQGVVSFAHGQFYMVGGYASLFFLDAAAEDVGIELNPVWGIIVAGFVTMAIGILFERFFLRPMHTGQIERAREYAILITFGFGFFMEYTTLATIGPQPHRAGRFIQTASLRLEPLTVGDTPLLGRLIFQPNRLASGLIAVLLIAALVYFLQRTWTGRGLRAVSMDKQAAAVTGINPLGMNTLAFGIGTMLAGMSGAALVPIFDWVPWVGAAAATRSYVVVVLGGLGSVPGALLGGLVLGVVEALGSGCYPNPSKGASYIQAFGLVIFAVVLLLKPTGLFGRKL